MEKLQVASSIFNYANKILFNEKYRRMVLFFKLNTINFQDFRIRKNLLLLCIYLYISSVTKFSPNLVYANEHERD